MPKMGRKQKKMLYLSLYHLIIDNPDKPIRTWQSEVELDPMYKQWVVSFKPMVFKSVLRAIDVSISIAQADGSEKIYHRRFIIQNKALSSDAAKRARNGAKIVQVYQGNWIDKIENGVIHSYKQKGW